MLASTSGATPVSGSGVSFAGESLFDKDYNVFNGGVSIDIPASEVNGIRVYRFKTLDIAGTLKFEPYYAPQLLVAFVVDGDVNITGTIDLSADYSWGSAGGSSAGYDAEGHCGVPMYSGASPSGWRRSGLRPARR